MTSQARPPKIIKRYANRKLYDTERSCYVTLDEIAGMIKLGDDVRVVDNKTKDDLTAVTLAQIIVEEEKKVQKMPLKLLRSIIQSGNDAVTDFYEKRLVDPVKTMRDDVERKVDTLLRRGDRAEEQKGSEAESQAHRSSAVQEFVSSTVEAFEAWQKNIDARVQEVLHRDGKPDIAALRKRVDDLEDKLARMETKPRQ
jgi:polyhydroxyalkanoate synthesis repressor PhaR